MWEALKRKILPDVTFQPAFLCFLLLYSCFQGAMHFSSIFVSLFLLVGTDMSYVCLYNACLQTAQMLTFYVTGYLGKKTSMALQVRIGMILLSIVYLTLILLGKKAAQYSILLGCLSGVANGFYYLAHSSMINELNSRDTVDAGLNTVSLISSVEGMVIPVLAGGIVSVLPGISGYLAVFSCSLVLMIVATVVSFRLPATKNSGSYRLGPPLCRYWKEKNWRRMIQIDVLRGFREGGLGFVVTVLIYLCIKNEFFVSLTSTISSLVGIVALSVILKRMNADNRLKYYRRTSLLMFLTACLLFWNQGIVTLFLFSMVSAIGNAVGTNASTAMEFDVLNCWEEICEYRVETFAIRETAVDSSRVAVLMLLFFIERQGLRDVTVIATYIAGICLVQFLLSFLLKRLQQESSESTLAE